MSSNNKAFYSAHTILFIIAVVVCIATWFIPAGKYERIEYVADEQAFVLHSHKEKITLPAKQETLASLGVNIEVDNFIDGKIFKPIAIPHTYSRLDSKPQGVIAFFQSFIKGFYGAIDIILLVLVIGGLIAIVDASGAFNKGISALSNALKGREGLLIVIAFSLTCIGGSTFGMAEEVIAFYPILIPVFLAAGYDVLVPLATLYLGATMGTLGSTTNPFSVMIASNAAGINWTLGMTPRLAMLMFGAFVVLFGILKYAKKIKADPTKSLVYFAHKEHLAHFLKNTQSAKIKLDTHSAIILALFITTFATMVYGVVSLEWWFVEMTTLFFGASLLISLIARLPEQKIVNTFIQGAQDLLSVAIIIAMARGVTVLMEDGLISDTILYYASLQVADMSEAFFVNALLMVNVGLGVIISSSSGLAVLTMPIFAPLADSIGVSRESVVNSYVFGFHLVQFISPTGLLLASLTIAKVPINAWLKFIWPILLMLFALSIIITTASVYL